MEKVGELVRRAQQGNLEAFASLVRQFQDMAFTVAYVRLGDEGLAEDAAQEGFIEAYLHIESLAAPEAFGGWLRRIVLRRCNRSLRRKALPTLSLDEAFDIPAVDPGPVEMLIGREIRDVLRRAIDSLPEHERAAVLLHYISGYPQNHIADFLEVPAATLRKRLQSARKRLKEKMMSIEEEYFEQRPSKGDSFGRTIRFFIAVRTGNTQEARGLLRGHPELAAVRENWSETLAHLYPRAQPDQAYRDLFKDREGNGWTPLHWAVWLGNAEMVRLLIEHGADYTGADWRGTSLLHAAARAGYREIVALLLDLGLDPNGGTDSSGPLHAAVAARRPETALLLLERGAAINLRDRFGRTPLHWGATSGHAEMVQLLVDRGAEIDPHDKRDRTPYWWARHSGHDDVADLLAAFGGGEGGGERKRGREESGPVKAGGMRGTEGKCVPVGGETLGRILDADGRPIDGGSVPFNTLVDQVRVGEEIAVGERHDAERRELLPIGIKPFDLFAPVPRNGIVSLIASWGVGKIVLLLELIRTMKVVHCGRSVVVTVEGGPHEAAEMESTYSEAGILDSMTVIMVPKEASAQRRREAFLNGMTIVRHALEVERTNVLFAVDQLVLDDETIPMLRQTPTHKNVSLLTVVSGYHHDELDPDEHPVPVDPDARIVFSPELARRGLYPAIDPFESESILLDSDILGSEHVRIAGEARRQIAAARKHLAEAGREGRTLTDEENRIVERVGRIERFLTQPFYVAQLQNGIPGEQVPVKETVESFAALLNGDYDHLPLGAFSYIGRVENAGTEEGERRI